MYDELVKRVRQVAEEICNDFDVDPYNAEQRCLAILKAADAIEELSKLNAEITRQELKLKLGMEKPRWIPVTERLPEEDGCYLVAVKNDHRRRYSKTAWFSHGSWFARQDVTHWRPLPEAPKEE